MRRSRPDAQSGGETLPEPSQAGSVVLDIGGGVGAAVVTTPAAMAGLEIEIRPVGSEWTGRHVAVFERQTVAGPSFAAVFGSLPAGCYQLRVRPATADGVVHSVTIEGGKVLTTTWPIAH
jgi:hypothetical protein